ncbi:MAG TPA: crosslink repair DNA glycosylase YcaQ family protein [Acidimicrobiia bacterium]
MAILALTRDQVLAHRRRAGHLDTRLPPGREALAAAALAGLQDSVPRSAVLSVHARVKETPHDVWEDPGFVQVWGPRYATYVVPESDRGIFTMSRLPADPAGTDRAYEIARRLHDVIGEERMLIREASERMRLGDHNALRYAAATGTVLVRWEGAGPVYVWTVPAPDLDPLDAAVELARRYLHVLGPGTAAGFGTWAGIKPRVARPAFERLTGELTPVTTEAGPAYILSRDEESFLAPPDAPAPARLLPSGDVFWLFHNEVDRAYLVPEEGRRRELWTSRVWPGAILVGGEIVGTWRRTGHRVTASPWRSLTPGESTAVEAEAATLPLPDLDRQVEVSWETAG